MNICYKHVIFLPELFFLIFQDRYPESNSNLMFRYLYNSLQQQQKIFCENILHIFQSWIRWSIIRHMKIENTMRKNFIFNFINFTNHYIRQNWYECINFVFVEFPCGISKNISCKTSYQSIFMWTWVTLKNLSMICLYTPYIKLLQS